jgi:hypothetical protein
LLRGRRLRVDLHDLHPQGIVVLAQLLKIINEVVRDVANRTAIMTDEQMRVLIDPVCRFGLR